MTKNNNSNINILIIGSTGFIGSSIYSTIKDIKDLSIYRYSSLNNEFLDPCNLKEFDLLIYCAGIHVSNIYENKHLIKKAKILFKNNLKFFNISKKIIFISSFKTSFNSKNKEISSKNLYNFYRNDSYYGKSKILVEKLFIKYCNHNNKKYLIVSPSHVIGPEDHKPSPNGEFFQNVINKKLILYPDCNIFITDVRNLSNYISILIFKKCDNKKIIYNNYSLKMSKYIDLIKKKEGIYIKIKINFYILRVLNLIDNYLFTLKIIKKKIISKSTYEYIKLQPYMMNISLNNDYRLKDTFIDTYKFFKKNGK